MSQLKIGDRARVLGFNHSADKCYRHRLMAMGLTRGAEFTVVRRAPLGDPVQISIRHSQLSLRQQEACLLELEQVVA